MNNREPVSPSATLEAMVRTHAPRPCWGVDTEVFFPQTSGGAIEHAKSICRGCPVRRPCVQYALNNKAEGVWGGTSDRERQDALLINRIDPAQAALLLADQVPSPIASPLPRRRPRAAG